MEAALRKAPRVPSALERATGCGPSSLMCVVIAAHKENLAWAKRLGHPTVVYRRHRSTTEPFVVPNVFHEHAVYLRYICAFYDRLPRLTAFLHGHATSWHNHNSASSQLLQMDLAAAARAGQVYRSFNDYKECWRDGRGEWHDEMLAQAQGWAREMAPFVGAEPPLKESYCCTQFVVSADRIRARPHAFWRHLLADLLDPAVPQVCKVSGHVLELTWGLLLGEPANAPAAATVGARRATASPPREPLTSHRKRPSRAPPSQGRKQMRPCERPTGSPRRKKRAARAYGRAITSDPSHI